MCLDWERSLPAVLLRGCYGQHNRGDDTLPACGDQRTAWWLSTEKLDDDRQRNGSHKRLLACHPVY